MLYYVVPELVGQQPFGSDAGCRLPPLWPLAPAPALAASSVASPSVGGRFLYPGEQAACKLNRCNKKEIFHLIYI